MAHTNKNFEHLLGECKAFLSEKQLQAHFTLYQGYVKKLNEIEEKLAKADPTTANYSFSEYSELRRREPVAYKHAQRELGPLMASYLSARRDEAAAPEALAA